MGLLKLLCVDTWKQSYKNQASIKADLKDCISCGCPISENDYTKYKMCPWCYSNLDIETLI